MSHQTYNKAFRGWNLALDLDERVSHLLQRVRGRCNTCKESTSRFQWSNRKGNLPIFVYSNVICHCSSGRYFWGIIRGEPKNQISRYNSWTRLLFLWWRWISLIVQKQLIFLFSRMPQYQNAADLRSVFFHHENMGNHWWMEVSLLFQQTMSADVPSFVRW